MGFDAFEKRFIDVDSSLGAKSYDRPGGIEDWIALTKAPSYTPYRHSREAWLAFLSSGWWMQAVSSQRYQTIFELGSGSGEDVSALGESFVGQPRPRLRLIDISKRALRYAYEEICGQTILPADSLDILYIRADFTKHLDRALSYAEAGSKMVCMLGGTFGNFKGLFGLLCGRILVASGWRRPIRRGKARFDCAPKMGRFSAWMNPCPNRRFWMAIAFPDFGFARGSSSMSAIQPAW